MKEYAVSVDITMAGTIYVEAESEEEAEAIAYGKAGYYLPCDMRNFTNVNREVVDVVSVED